jgi:predicted Zn-dependent protease
MPRAINFLKLGYQVRQTRPALSDAARNTTAFFMNQYIHRGRVFEADAPELYRRCNAILSRLCQIAGLNPNNFKLSIIGGMIEELTDGIQPNAWIFRETGDICLTTGLLKKEGLTEGELAAVLSHELGHFLKYQPNREIPKRFKNPLFREYARGTLLAKRQNEEFEGDELGLLLLDGAGYSVDEAISMANWLSTTETKKRSDGTKNNRRTVTPIKILDPYSTHPNMGNRIGIMQNIIEHPKFAWKNRNAASKHLLDKSMPRLFSTHTEIPSLDDLMHTHHLDLMDIKTVNRFARETVLDQSSLVFDFTRLFLEAENLERPAGIIKNLKEQGKNGDLVSRAYLQALLCAIYIKAVRKGRATEALRSLEKENEIEVEEVMLSLLSFFENIASNFDDFESDLASHIPHFDDKVFSEPESLSFLKVTLKQMVNPLPRSFLRDHIIGELLRLPHLIKGREKYTEINYPYNPLGFPLGFDELKISGVKDLVRLLHGSSLIAQGELYETLNELREEKHKGTLDKLYIYKELDKTMDSSLADQANYVLDSAGPYDRAKLEASLEESVAMATALDKIENPSGPDIVISDDSLQPLLIRMYRHHQSVAARYRDPFLKERVLQFGRIVLLRHLEAIPVEFWNKETIRAVKKMPRSSEKNQLLILLHLDGKEPLDEAELVFEKIPQPDEAQSLGPDLTLLNSFGFIEPGAAEVIYPSGQRVLDRFMAKKFPQKGRLLLDQVVQTIPRPSPGRDELLDRVRIRGLKHSQALLDAYWSPAAAYTKAYQICRAWMKRVNSADPKTFQAILEITAEFPSLRRRMAREWTDRFGITQEEYPGILTARSETDVIDVFNGGIIELSKSQSHLARTALALASFSSSLSRDEFSLLSVQRLEHSRFKEWSEFEFGRGSPSDADSRKNSADAIRFRINFYSDYFPLHAENTLTIARLILEDTKFSLHSIPFMDNKPLPNPRFTRHSLITEEIKEMKKWKAGELFTNFMQAMGAEEAIAFYEELFLGRDGIAKDAGVFRDLENIFMEGIGLLLQEKKVPLARAETVKNGIQELLTKLPYDVRVRVWIHILASISQKLSIGEITREAVRPLRAAGGKLMQTVHSLTTGIDSTLEEATRLALDQTARFSLLDGIQFLAFRLPKSPFDQHQKYTLLGQGTVRAAIGGIGGTVPEEAFLMVHAGPSQPDVISGIQEFISKITSKGNYFPLSANQFKGLVIQTEEERVKGFTNHIEYGELHKWKLAQVTIPRIIEHNHDWSRVELVAGLPYASLASAERKRVAQELIDASLAQFSHPVAQDTFLINPEFHKGNILVDRNGKSWLVDCGLIGTVNQEDLNSLLSVFAGYRSHGLPQAAASLFHRNSVSSLSVIDEQKRKDLVNSIKTIGQQLEAGIPPELLFSSLVSSVNKTLGSEVKPGADILFRALQHLAPYFHELGQAPKELSAMLDSLSQKEPSGLSREIQAAMQSGDQAQQNIIPKGIAVGKKTRSGGIYAVGVLTEDLDLEPSKPPAPNMVRCKTKDLAQYVLRQDLMIQTGSQWIPIEEYLKKRS